ncbi:MAG: B12-binding domain-containing radical SAM protein [Rhodospirillales bacterium]
MKVLLVSANTETMNMLTLPLGAACVAAAAQDAGHETRLLDLAFEPDPQQAIADAAADLQPDVIGISVRNIDDQQMERPRFLLAAVRDVVAACRAASPAPVVLGGAGFSIFPESVLRYLGADLGIQGEGEAPFVALLEQIGRGADPAGIPGVCLPGCAVKSRRLASLQEDPPLPEPDLWIPPAARGPGVWTPVQSRRGCPLNCSYCPNALVEGAGMRRRSPQLVAEWMSELREAGQRDFAFVDNVFNLPLWYAKELCRSIIQADLDANLWCIVYPKWIDGELVELMRRAGCSQVSLGFESGSARMLRSYNKQFDAAEVRATSELFRAAGIKRMGFLLLGGPGETRDTVEESLAFADSLELDALRITIGIRIYPGTPLHATALAEGVIQPGEDLLWPRFYMAAELREWLPERVARYTAGRPWAN